ncbi:hypothetical protein K501DRAFT_287551 [Backusella circina FSU 941]|nr:hypothetical protein K501DRAFT_287551 [Backusella circina FSU 941]
MTGAVKLLIRTSSPSSSSEDIRSITIGDVSFLATPFFIFPFVVAVVIVVALSKDGAAIGGFTKGVVVVVGVFDTFVTFVFFGTAVGIGALVVAADVPTDVVVVAAAALGVVGFLINA